MSDINVTSTEAQRPGEQQGDIIKKAKDFLTSSLRWSFALLGVKESLINMQGTFIAVSIALIALFSIGSRTTRSGHGMAFINFTFLMLGCLVVGKTINSIEPNSYIKWIIYGMFLLVVATNPDYQQAFQEMKQICEAICRATALRLINLFVQSQIFIANLLKINIKGREESSMNNNHVTGPVEGDGGEVGEDIV